MLQSMLEICSNHLIKNPSMKNQLNSLNKLCEFIDNGDLQSAKDQLVKFVEIFPNLAGNFLLVQNLTSVSLSNDVSSGFQFWIQKFDSTFKGKDMNTLVNIMKSIYKYSTIDAMRYGLILIEANSNGVQSAVIENLNRFLNVDLAEENSEKIFKQILGELISLGDNETSKLLDVLKICFEPILEMKQQNYEKAIEIYEEKIGGNIDRQEDTTRYQEIKELCKYAQQQELGLIIDQIFSHYLNSDEVTWLRKIYRFFMNNTTEENIHQRDANYKSILQLAQLITGSPSQSKSRIVADSNLGKDPRSQICEDVLKWVFRKMGSEISSTEEEIYISIIQIASDNYKKVNEQGNLLLEKQIQVLQDCNGEMHDKVKA